MVVGLVYQPGIMIIEGIMKSFDIMKVPNPKVNNSTPQKGLKAGLWHLLV